MKAYIIYIIAASALLIPAGGCSDGLAEGGAATDGDIVTFSATVAPMTGDTQTRATVDGTFEEGNTIGVLSKGDTKAKTYVYRSGQFVPATDADATRWQGTANEQKTLTAWYPNVEMDKAFFLPINQSSDENFAAADFLYTEIITITRTQTSLLFKRINNARITVNLRAGTGISKAALSLATVKLLAFNTNKYSLNSDGTISINAGSVSGPVYPHERTPATAGYIRTFDVVVEAITFQYDKQPDPIELIRITIDDNKDYSYRKILSSENPFLYFKENRHYTYNVTVNDDGLTLAPPTGGTWEQGGGKDENIKSDKANSTPSNNP